MVVNIEDVKKDDEDLDEFEEIEDELKEEKKEEEKKEDDKKINWKKILPYVGVGVICFLLGKKRQRFVLATKYTTGEPEYDWNSKDLKAINEYIDHMNKYYKNNTLVMCHDKKRKYYGYLNPVKFK